MLTIIEIKPLRNGAHNNMTLYHATKNTYSIPDGWCYVPDEMKPLKNFPFGTARAEKINGTMTLTGWDAEESPAPVPQEPDEPTELDDMSVMLVDHELRLSLLELDMGGGEF